MRLLLHPILALLLILNGIGSVAAATRMAVAVPVAAQASGHCESMAHAAADDGLAQVDGMHSPADPSEPRCCGTDHACDCACLQVASPALAHAAPLPLTFDPAAIPVSSADRHSAPPLPSPLRPPIA